MFLVLILMSSKSSSFKFRGNNYNMKKIPFKKKKKTHHSVPHQTHWQLSPTVHHCKCCWWLNNIFFLSFMFKPSPLRQTNWPSGKLQDRETVTEIVSVQQKCQSLDAVILQKEGQAFTTVAFLIYLQMTWGGLKVESWKGMCGSQSPVGEAVKSHRCNVWCDTELPAPPGLTVTVTSTKFFLTNYHTFTGQSQTVFLWEKTIFHFYFFYIYVSCLIWPSNCNIMCCLVLCWFLPFLLCFHWFLVHPRLANTPLGNASLSDSGSPAHYQRLCGFGLAKDSTEKKTSRVDR